MASTMTVQCPSCDTAFPVDPRKVPDGGVRTQCTVCETMFRVDPPESDSSPVSESSADDAVAGGSGFVEVGPAVFAGEADTVTEDLATDAGEVAESVVPESRGVPEAEEVVQPEDEPGPGEAESFGGFDVEVVDVEVDEEAASAGAHEMEEALAQFAAEDDPSATTDAADESSADSEPEEPESASGTGTTTWSDDLGDDWVIETEETTPFGNIEVERLDTVEEQMRSAQEEEVPPEEGIEQASVPGPEGSGFSDFMTADEVMLSDSDLDTPVGEVAEAGGAPEPVRPEETELESPPLASDALAEVEGAFAPEAGVEAPVEEASVEAEAVEPPTQPSGGFQFGKRDPHEKARRLARVLVSDMITYNPDRHTRALEEGTLEEDFEEEIDKSWAEYVEQVGSELAESTSYWSEALNEILAKGEPLF